VGLQVRRCEEVMPAGHLDTREMPGDILAGPWDSWPWSLLEIVPAAASAAWAGTPATVIWDFQLSVPVLPGA
jgi:hypothetical protein